MATATSPLTKTVDTLRPHSRRNRKDVLGLAEISEAEYPTLLQTFQKLAQAGFSVNQTGPAHWIIRGRTPLPEFHCYSEQEIHQFTANKT